MNLSTFSLKNLSAGGTSLLMCLVLYLSPVQTKGLMDGWMDHH